MNHPVLRWLMLLLLVLDLASSPLHAHLHESGGQALPTQAAAAMHASELHMDEEAGPGHQEEAPVSGHSLDAMRNVQQQQPGPGIATILPPRITPASLPASAVLVLRAAPPTRSPISAIQHLRPDGRAPPLLRA